MSGKAVRETLGFLTVVLGLAFVGWELRLNTRSAEVGAYQELTGQISDLLVLEVESRPFASVLDRAYSAGWDALDETDRSQVTAFLWLLFRHGDMAFYQYERGVLDDARLQSALAPLSGRLSIPFVQERWTALHRRAFVESYQRYVDSMASAVR